MIFTLSYVNMPDNDTAYLDKEFTNAVELMDYVTTTYPDFTSYQVIVLRV